MSREEPSSFHGDAIIRAYIDRLTAMDRNREREQRMTAEDLRTLARELGMSETDLQRVDAATEAHLTRGRNFCDHGAFDDAIFELEKAAVLRPFDAAVICDLARAHYGRYRKSGQAQDRTATETLARRAISLDANCKPAYGLLSAVQRGGSARGVRLGLYAALGGIVAVAVTSGVLLLKSSGARPNAVIIQAVAGTPATPPNLYAAPAGAQPAVVPAPAPEENIPAKLESGEGLSLNVERSRLQRYQSDKTSYSYTLHGTLRASEGEIGKMSGTLVLLSADGKAVEEQHVQVWGDHQPRLRPGDSAPVNVLVFRETQAPAVAAAALRINLVDRTAAAAAYDPGEPVELAWKSARPAHIDIDVRERDSQVKQIFDKTSHWLTLTVTNRGSRQVDHLRMAIRRYDAAGKEVGAETAYVTSSAGPALQPGETWVVRDMADLAKDGGPLARYDVTVVEAE